jgi:transcriptional/translational regulatory protein YebC/TACO1
MEVLTDNINRAAADTRSALNKAGSGLRFRVYSLGLRVMI